jgi:hypothetical protein
VAAPAAAQDAQVELALVGPAVLVVLVVASVVQVWPV